MDDSPNILLVDDEHRFLESLKSILSHYNYRCTLALSGAEAIELLTSRTFEVALLDVQLPDMSGCEIAKFIAQSKLAVTFIMLTGVNTVDTAVQSMKLGAYDFLNKPLKHDVLLKTLKMALQHNRLKKELGSSEERFRILAEAAWEGIAIHEKGEIIEVNSPFMKMFGYTREDISSGLHLHHLFDSAESGLMDSAVQNKNSKPQRTSGRHRNGTLFPVETKLCSLIHNGSKRGVLVVRDLTEREKFDREKIELQKKLAVANKLNALGLMAGSVAHDLNNILTGIVSYPDLLLSQMNQSDPYYKQINKIKAAGKRAADVVSDLVSLTRGRVQQKDVANINDLISSYLGSLEHTERLSAYPGITLESDLQKDLFNSCCSPTHIHKLLLNLTGNALEAIAQDGKVRISTENCRFSHPLHPNGNALNGSKYIKLVVEDNGPGIPDEDTEKIFDPFYTRKKVGQSGTGLGLSVVWNIVQDHDGWIEVKDNGPGARFEVYLPAALGDQCPVEPVISLEDKRGRGERILIVDDQEEQNEILENGLTSLGYTTYSVTSGEEAIDFLENRPVDLILMDMIMGEGLNGRETLEIIQQKFKNQKAIVISGYAKREEIEKTRALGISCFLEKPVTLAEINHAIHKTFCSP
jgi:two-component system cell cycle sensor histidine kinase/response regulator CckA